MSLSTENQENYLLKVENLKKHFPISDGLFSKSSQTVKAVDGVNLHVSTGETLGIVGESGCGKSTFGGMVLSLLEPTEGKIFFEGKDISELPKKDIKEMKKNIQMIFQDPFSSLNPRMNVFDIIAEPLRTHSVGNENEIKEIIYELIENVGLDRTVLKRYPHEFSGGQRQRIGIARAIALKPKLIVCDEPVSALDVSIQAQILNLLVKLQKEYDLTFIFIGHGIPSVKYISDRIAVMYMGEIVEVTTKERLFSHTKHPYTEGLISAVPIPDPKLRDKSKRVVIKNDIPDQVDIPKGCRFYSRCPYRTEKCLEIKPELKEVDENHSVACHYPLG